MVGRLLLRELTLMLGRSRLGEVKVSLLLLLLLLLQRRWLRRLLDDRVEVDPAVGWCFGRSAGRALAKEKRK